MLFRSFAPIPLVFALVTVSSPSPAQYNSLDESSALDELDSAETTAPAIISSKNLSCPPVGANGKSLFLWTVDSDELQVRSYLFGTIHVAYDQVWDHVSSKVKEVFAEVDSVVFELELHNAETIDVLLRCKNLSGRQRLEQLIPTDIYARLKDYMSRFRYRIAKWAHLTHPTSKIAAKRTARRLYSNLAGQWETRRPVWMLFLLYQLGDAFAHSVDQESPMLDVYLAQLAQEAGKRLDSIETPEEQCDPLVSVDDGQLLFSINYTLAYLEWLEEKNDGAMEGATKGLSALIDHYRCGSLDASVFSAKRFVQGHFTLSPDLDAKARYIDQLLVDDIIRRRNVRMAHRVHALLRANPAQARFIAIGAGHFLGDASLIDVLGSYGYKVTAVHDGDDLAAGIAAERAQQRQRQRDYKRFNAIWVRDEHVGESRQDAHLRSMTDHNHGLPSHVRQSMTPAGDVEVTISLYETSAGTIRYSDEYNKATKERYVSIAIYSTLIITCFFARYLYN